MNPSPPSPNPEFDAFAENYDEALDKGIAISGESKEYFAKGRVDCLAENLRALSFVPRRMLDFGCGTGTATPFLLQLPGVQHLTGLEVSSKSLDVARQAYGSERVRFQLCSEYQAVGDTDLAFCNGVFHHIPPAEREAAARSVFAALRPGGLFAWWENNPWNPGTRYVMSRIPFDRDAIMLSARESRRLLRRCGFEIVRTDFLFFFPAPLRFLRCLEPCLKGFPLGAQYQVMARRPLSNA